MTGFGRAFRAEWLRLAGGRARWLLPTAALLSAGYTLALAAAVSAGLLGTPSGFFLAAAACSGAALTAAAVGALHAAGAVAADQASGLLRAVLSRPVGRSAWLGGRLATLAIAQGLVFLAACLGAVAAGLLRFGAGPVTDGGHVLAGSGFLTGQLLIALGLSLLAQVAAVALGGVVGIVVGRPGAAVVAACLLGAALLALGRWPSIERLLPLPTVTTALDRVAELAQGIAAHRAGEGGLQAAAVCLLWLGLTLTAGAAALARAEVVA
jgi:ABC-type transport system involved in multi-copper enzyme maturation permease subunit